jgi:phosphate transport system substrate-binding protein
LNRRAGLLATLSCACLAQVLINSAGATFPYPIYARWFDAFYRLHPDAQINYQSVGSGFGIRQLDAGVLDFGASDRPLSDAELARSRNGVLHLPTVIGAVVPVYNIPRLGRELNFTAAILAGIFSGRITIWDDALLAQANRGVRLPAAPITVVHRSDASGTTYIFTDFLSRAGVGWDPRLPSTSHQWRTGFGARGNEGVAGMVKQTPFSIGYAEHIYAAQNQISYGRVQNAAGRFVRADSASIRAAAESLAARMPDDFRVSIVDAPGKNAYPIASYTWLLIPATIRDPAKRQIVVSFLRWMLTDGQRMAEPLGYAPLPARVVERAQKSCSGIR